MHIELHSTLQAKVDEGGKYNEPRGKCVCEYL